MANHGEERPARAVGFVVVLWDGVAEKRRPEGDVPVLTYDDVIESGRKKRHQRLKASGGILDPNIKERMRLASSTPRGRPGSPRARC